MYFSSLFRFLRDADLDQWRQKIKSEKILIMEGEYGWAEGLLGEAFGAVHLGLMKKEACFGKR